GRRPGRRRGRRAGGRLPGDRLAAGRTTGRRPRPRLRHRRRPPPGAAAHAGRRGVRRHRRRAPAGRPGLDPAAHARGRGRRMTAQMVAAAVAVAGLLLLVPYRRRSPAHRLAHVVGGWAEAADGHAGPTDRAAGSESVSTGAGPAGADRAGARRPGRAGVRIGRREVVAGLVAVAVGLLAGGWWGVPLAVGAGLAVHLVLRRLESPESRARGGLEAADLPLCADLLAVALRGGVPVDRAAAAVADALPGALGERLGRVARLLQLGATPAEAWRELAPVTGADRLIRAAVRSADHGAALS